MIEITEEHYETLLKLIEQLQKDKASMQELHNELITKIMTLNGIIFERTNDIIYLEKTIDNLRKMYDKASNDSGKLKQQKEIASEFVKVSLNLGQEILENERITDTEQKFLD